MKTKGTIYEEVTCTRQSTTIGRVMKRRFVGEIVIDGKRYRFRSTSKENVENFLTSIAKNKDYKPRNAKSSGLHKDNTQKLVAVIKEQVARFEEIKKQKLIAKRKVWKKAGVGKRIIGKIPPNMARVLRYRYWSDVISFGVNTGREICNKGYRYCQVTREHNKIFVVCSAEAKTGYNKIYLYEYNDYLQAGFTLSSTLLLQELDKAFGKILRHGQFLSVMSSEVRANGDLYLEIKA